MAENRAKPPSAAPVPARVRAAAAILTAAFFALALSASRHASLTWDEPSFLSAGYAYLTRGEFRFNPSHPPLAQDLVAAPLLGLDLAEPPGDWKRWLRLANPVVAFGQEFVYRSGNDPQQIAAWARFPVLCVGAALVAGVFAAARRRFGPYPALVAAGAAAFSPDLAAHAGLATEDLICSATMFAAFAAFERALGGRRRGDWVRCGLLTGLALASKYTALLLVPAYAVLFLAARWRARPAAIAREGGVALAIVLAIAALVVGASYNFRFDLSLYVRGFRSIYEDLAPNQVYYLFGEVSERPFPHYHVAAFLVKTPLPILVLLGWALVRIVREPRVREAAFALLVPVVLVFGASLFDRMNFGVRRVLPAFPFLFTLAGVVVAGSAGRAAHWAAAALVSWCALESVAIHPHPLSYFNQAVGGPARGPYLLDDSNVDWGQDLPALAAWQRAHPQAKPLRLSYFGTADPAAYGVDAVPMEREQIAKPRPGWYAVSANRLVWFRKLALRGGEDTDWLSRYEPVDRAGWSIWIYRFD
jgi:4-amino-4-deoxy-L-arabinose transferase-like glycosyltransferase